MFGVELRQFALPGVLKGVGRKTLQEFLARFQPDLAANHVPVPDPSLPDDAYFDAFAFLLDFPECLPPALNDALFAIAALSDAEGQECLHAAIAQAGLQLPLDFDCSPERLAMEVWLKAPDLVLDASRQHGPPHLVAFECFGTSTPKRDRAPFVPPDAVGVHHLTVPIVLWFAEHHQAVHSTRLDFQPLHRGQNWFHVRHGDTSRWTRTIGAHETEFTRFRLEDQETILYSAEDDELWISARADAEREFYRQQFGLSLRGIPDYFSQRRRYRLEPLRTEGTDSLPNDPADKIHEVILREIQVKWDGAFRGSTTHSSDEVFRGDSAIRAQNGFVPSGGTLVRAAFLFRFSDSPTLRASEICLPNKLKVEHPSDLLAVARWAVRCGLAI